MSTDILILCGTAAFIGFTHTVFGPDHYLPFIMMSKARKWSLSKTALITLLCGIGHILGSVLLGVMGVVLGIAVFKLEALEAYRGTITAWLLIGFGFAYFIWGIRRAIKNKPHKHVHFHGDSTVHSHEHTHNAEHVHVHAKDGKELTPWILFIIFAFGPCEPLIPLLMYPAAQASMTGMFMVAGVFGAVTVLTMLGIVLLSSWGFSFAKLGRLERYVHAIAGAMICISGLGIQFLGL